jgi:hypothetical protein
MSHHRYHSSAPFGIKSLAVVTVVDGLLSVGTALELLAGSAPALALVVGLVGAAHVALAYGLWQLEPYAFPLGVAMFAASALLDLLAGSPMGAVLSGLTLSMLYHYRGLYRE